MNRQNWFANHQSDLVIIVIIVIIAIDVIIIIIIIKVIVVNISIVILFLINFPPITILFPVSCNSVTGTVV